MPLLRQQDSLQAETHFNEDQGALTAPTEMKYRAQVSVEGDAALITKVFSAEDTSIKDSAYSLARTAKGVTFKVSAADSIGLRTTLNAITKVLTVIEKMQGI